MIYELLYTWSISLQGFALASVHSKLDDQALTWKIHESNACLEMSFMRCWHRSNNNDVDDVNSTSCQYCQHRDVDNVDDVDIEVTITM